MYLDKWSLLGILIMLLLACLMFMLVLLLVWWYCSSPALLLQAALKAAQQTKDGREDEITILRTEIEVSSCYSLGAVCFFYCHWSSFLLLFFFFLHFFFVQNLKDDTANAMEQLQEAEAEAKALRTMTQRMILTHEEMVVVWILMR